MVEVCGFSAILDVVVNDATNVFTSFLETNGDLAYIILYFREKAGT